jgi:signal transduction histidine kinase
LLIGSLAVVLSGFVAESVHMFHHDRRVEEEAERWSSTTQGRVQHMQSMRWALLDLSLCPVTNGRSSADALACMTRSRAQIGSDLDGIERAPSFPGRAPALAALQRELDVLDSRLTTLRAAGEGAGREAAIAGVLATLEPLNHALDQLAGAAVQRALRHTSEVGAAVRRSEIAELVAAAAAFLIAALATLAGVRSMRRYQRVLAAKADELDRFASTVAHDLLSPLASLGVCMPVIQERHPDDEQTQRMTSRALSSVKRVRALVDELLDYARAGAQPSGARAPAAKVVAEVVNELSEQAIAARAEVSIEEMADVSVACSAGVLYSIVSNLLTNALKYLGDVSVRQVRIRVRARGAQVQFEVEDTGHGVPAALARTIFQPYVRGRETGQPGFGLGLATVKRLVSAHGGEVGLRSAPSGGAIFWFALPGSGGPVERPEPRASA